MRNYLLLFLSVCVLVLQNVIAGPAVYPAVDAPNLFDTSVCMKCGIDEHYERGYDGQYVSCKCVRNADGRVQSDMIVDEVNRGMINAVFGRLPEKKPLKLLKLYWPNSLNGTVEIPYVVNSSLPKENEEALFKAMLQFEQQTCIRFIYRDNEKDFIEFVGQDGCWSYLGRRGGRQRLSLGKACSRVGIIQHELMHALGFWHEHSRPDRSKYMKVQYENVIPGEESNFDRVKLQYNFLDLDYDYESVLHFGELAYSKNGQKTILVKNPLYEGKIGQRSGKRDDVKTRSEYLKEERTALGDYRCGSPVIKRNAYQRIVGGMTAYPGQFPWQASIRYNTIRSHICGGSLIDKQWVLTAAHCIRGKDPDPRVYFVYLGLHEKKPPKTIDDRSDHHLLVKVARIIRHKYYNSNNMENDIALLKLEEPVQFTDYILPVCIGDSSISTKSGQLVTVSGWGRTVPVFRSAATHLMKVDLQVIGKADCKAWLAPYIIHDNMLCAGYEKGKKDACQVSLGRTGDSGGPLTQKVNGRHYLVGVVSWGLGCAMKRRPGVYAKVSYFRKWILQNSKI